MEINESEVRRRLTMPKMLNYMAGEHAGRGDTYDVGSLQDGLALGAASWVRSGRPRYVLSSSIACLLAATRTPAVGHELRLPHDGILIEIPGDLTSIIGEGPLHVFVCRQERPDGVCASVDSRVIVFCMRGGGDGTYRLTAFDAGNPADDRSDSDLPKECLRLAVNTVLYLTAHRQSVTKRVSYKKKDQGHQAFSVESPVGVSVTATFRNHVTDLIRSRTLGQAKSALMHFVRGHWKQQAYGSSRSERALIWIQPYARGVEALGRVESRIVTVH